MLNMYGLIRSQELVRPVGKDLVVSDTRHPTPRWVVNKEDVLVMSKADRIWDEMYKTFKLQHLFENMDQWTFNQYAGLSIVTNTIWLTLIYTVLVYNNYLAKFIIKSNVKNKILIRLSSFYAKFINIENYTLALMAIIPLSSLLLVGYWIFQQY